MTEHEKKIKEFVSDGKNLEALTNDKEFISKIASEKATAETYREKLEELGLEISIDEAEKIKAFSDSANKKLEALIENEEFINKVAGGKATPEIYREELKKVGLEVGENDAEHVKNTVNKIFEMPAEKIKLDDDFLKCVAGGTGKTDNINDNEAIERSLKARISSPQAGGTKSNSSDYSQALGWGLGIGIPALAWIGSAVGCAIAGAVYKKRGNSEKAEKCNNAAIGIGVVPIVIAGGIFIAGAYG